MISFYLLLGIFYMIFGFIVFISIYIETNNFFLAYITGLSFMMMAMLCIVMNMIDKVNNLIFELKDGN